MTTYATQGWYIDIRVDDIMEEGLPIVRHETNIMKYVLYLGMCAYILHHKMDFSEICARMEA